MSTIAFVLSNSNAGKPLHAVHADLVGRNQKWFLNRSISQEIDVLFLCVGHGDAKKFLAENDINEKIKIIDLSQDFRLLRHSPMAAATSFTGYRN